MSWIGIQERANHDVVILDLSGALTFGFDETDPLLAKVQELLQSGHRKILLNLSRTPYLDSSGFAELVRAHTTATHAGGIVKLCGVHERILRLLEMHRLRAVIEIFDSEDDAVSSFSVTAPRV